MPVDLYHGDCLDVLPTLPENSVHAVVCDPPYGLSGHATTDVAACLTAWLAGHPFLHHKTGMMAKSWDGWVPGPEVWRECLRVLKPGGHLLCFAGTRSMDLVAMAIRLAGFELRDSIGSAHDDGAAPLCAWVHGQGMPHGLNISKALSKAGGTAADAAACAGQHTALRPAWEPILIARKPLHGTAVENALRHGTGGLNIDDCRIPVDAAVDDPRLGGQGTWTTGRMAKSVYGSFAGTTVGSHVEGRFPANVVTDGSDAVNAVFAEAGERTSGTPGVRRKPHQTHSMSGTLNRTGETESGYAGSGSAARFFQSCEPTPDEMAQTANRFIYHAKATAVDRCDSKHVSVKPIALMRYLCRLVTPRGGVVLDPFAGSGTTGQAALDEGCDAILIEREAEYCDDIRHRLFMFIGKDIQADGRPSRV